LNYVEVRIETSLDAGELLCAFEGTAPLGAWQDGDFIRLYWREDDWNCGLHEELASALSRLGVAVASTEIQAVTVPDRDWNLAWARSLVPIRIGKKVGIRQSWNREDNPAPIELTIDPKRAFGTGFHASTQLLVEMLEDEIAGGELVLDVGTGSGILAMVALRLGAACATGVDADTEAIECALEYASLNGFGPELELRVTSASELGSKTFDVVLANLDRNTVLANAEVLCRAAGAAGRLLISGLLHDDAPDVAEALTAAGAAAIEMKRRGEWIALRVAFIPHAEGSKSPSDGR
jgi:ribosomal protein L11 methyltransferase